MNLLSRLLKNLGSLLEFILFVLRRFPLMRLTLALILALLVLEYVAFSLMIPLAGDREVGSSINNGIVMRFWIDVATQLSLKPSRISWLWLFVLLLAMRTLLGYLYVLLSTWVSKQVHQYFSDQSFRRVLLTESMTQIYRRSIGYYLKIAGDDTFKAGSIVLSASQTLANLTSVIACFLLLFLFSTTIFGWVILFIALMAIAVSVGLVLMLRTNVRSAVMSSGANTSFIEAINSLRSIRSMNAEDFVIANYNLQIRRYVRSLFEIEAIKSSMKFLPGIVALIAGAIVLWPGDNQTNMLDTTFFLAATTLLIRLFVSLGSLVNTTATMMSELRAVRDIDALINTTPPSLGEMLVLGDPGVIISSITLSSIHYGYRDNQDILNGIDLTLNRGQIIAFIGPSGTGKSTLADLLLGLIHPRSGEIRVNNVKYPLEKLGSRVVLVEQHARIFSTTLRENILLGAHYDDDAIWETLRLVDLEGFVCNLPLGLDEIFDYQGANLSGGQCQRIGIARALIRRPQVLILDEATSALDGATRNQLLSNLNHSKQNRITILITHDDSIAQYSDAIVDLGKFGSIPIKSPVFHND